MSVKMQKCQIWYFMFVTTPVLYRLIHLSDFYSIAINFVAFLHREKSLLSLQSFLKLLSFFTISSWVYDTDLITALTKEITRGFSSAQHIGIFCIPIFWLWSRCLNTTDVLSRCIRVFDHAELIAMTFVFSGLLSFTKCYGEFRSFQANYPNPYHCLQNTLSEAVLTSYLMRSFKSCLILSFPVDFTISLFVLLLLEANRYFWTLHWP